ncbi:brain-specific angiogenesis inhibitor 1-associated protein 2-like protein 1a [Pristis pectinata]|uniref:brain-specific angiogenesis inhibitor 1-associated protein 2-like protein 1a n=1 Tax=Pristis pectinata TaxID=685728 RepID=UPI00223CCD12|nr:brain-specific angiogenesis inhibitor 1-associated protein 2-like protein 1a [Pristis pectinata]
MSRKPEDINRLTENTYKTVLEQFNPGLRNLVNLGKNYEKAVSAMVAASKTYFDAISKLGELSSQSPVSRELGQVLMEISEVHKKLNFEMEDNFRKFHKDIISELEKKTDQDVKYMNATLKKYQTEHRTKLDSLEKSQAELKKLRRKSQGTKNAYKYENKEMEFLATISTRENDIQRFITDGCKEALLEEKRRFCFLADKHCSFSQDLSNYHEKANGLLRAKIINWQDKCLEATKVPDFLNEDDGGLPSYLSKTPQPSPMIGRYSVHDAGLQNNLKIPPAPPGKIQKSPLPDMFNNPNAQRMAPIERNIDTTEDVSLSRSISVATGLNMVQRPKVKSIFPHTAGNNKNMLSFAEGDVLTLLIPEEKDGWLYGEHDMTKMRGWFPTSYTRPIEQGPDMSPGLSTAPARSMSILNLAERSNVALPPPDYESMPVRHHKEMTFHSYSSAPNRGILPQPDNTNSSSEVNGTMKPPFLSGGNPFATVKLRPTVTNDRSAPVI